MDGHELAARFSYITNCLGYCGPEDIYKKFLEYINKKSFQAEIENSLKRFEGLYPYLSAIAKKSGKKFTDYDVVEAYWLGNSLLDNFTDEDITEIIMHLTMRGLPESIGKTLTENLPLGFVPHHNFNVFYVGVGRTTGKVETNLTNMDNCRISFGRVVEIFDERIIVMVNSLKKLQGKFLLGEEEPRTAVYIKEMIPNMKKNDYVALHWGFAPMVLDERQLENLKKYSQTILDVMNANPKNEN